MQDENQPAEESVAFICEICMEPTPFPVEKSQTDDPCSHPFCTNCMAKYIAAQLELGTVNIPCPALACDRSLDPLTWGPLVGPATFDRWCDALCEDSIADLSRRCCPQEDFGALIVNECGGRPRESMCPECGRWFCFGCGRILHAWFKCEEVKDENDIALEKLAEQKKWKRCPFR